MVGYPFYTNLLQDRIQSRLDRQIASPELKQAYIDRNIGIGDSLTRIIIPDLDVDVVVVEGTTASALRAGAGHYPDTPLPCEIGNVGIAGHRTTYGRPFHNMDLLKPGMEITLQTPIGDCTYEITQEPFAVSPKSGRGRGQHARRSHPHPHHVPSEGQRPPAPHHQGHHGAQQPRDRSRLMRRRFPLVVAVRGRAAADGPRRARAGRGLRRVERVVADDAVVHGRRRRARHRATSPGAPRGTINFLITPSGDRSVRVLDARARRQLWPHACQLRHRLQLRVQRHLLGAWPPPTPPTTTPSSAMTKRPASGTVAVAMPAPAVTGVSASGGGRSITVVWNDMTFAAPDLSGYVVERQIGDGAFMQVAALGVDATSFVDDSLPTNAGQATYRVSSTRPSPDGTKVSAASATGATPFVAAPTPPSDDGDPPGDGTDTR